MAKPFKDLFSGHSKDYAEARPDYPEALFEWIKAHAPACDTAWDCGTGSGQAAVALAKHFKRVFATDASEQQIAQAVRAHAVEYRAAPAERSGLESASVDCITVAQALHWFDHAVFWEEVKRVSKPGALLVAWAYSLAHISPSIDLVVQTLYQSTLGPYWQPERRLVDTGYKTMVIPFAEIYPPRFEMSKEWTLEDWVRYLRTWSAYRIYLQKNPGTRDPIDTILPQLQALWGTKARLVRWPLHLRAFKVNASVV